MRDEQVSQILFFFQVLQQIDDLGLYGYIKRGDRFIADDKLGAQGRAATSWS